MKRNTFLAVIATTIVTGSLFWGCNKEQRNELSGDLKSKPVSSDMLYFDNFEQLFAEMANISKMSDEKRIVYEKSRKFTSFATVTEALYLPKIEKGETTDATIKELMSKYPDYFQLTTDEWGTTFEPCLPSTMYRYIANQNRMFQVGDMVYKVFEDGIVFADKDNYKLLMTVTDNNLDNLSPELTLISNHSDSKMFYDNVTVVVERATLGKNRLKLTVETRSDPNNYDRLLFPYGGVAELRPYHQDVIIWWWCKRSIKADLIIGTHFFSTYDKPYRVSCNTSPEYSYKDVFDQGTYYNTNNGSTSFTIFYITGYAETPNVTLYLGSSEPTAVQRRR